jgi:DNA-binding NtrC family response regulator
MALVSTCTTQQEYPGVVVASSKADFRKQMLETLQGNHWFAEEALGGADAMAKLDTGECQVLLLDRWLPDLDVSELVETIRDRYPGVDVLLMDSETGQSLNRQDLPLSSHGRQLAQLLQAPPESSVGDCEAGFETSTAQTKFSVPPRVEPLPGMIGTSEELNRVYRLTRLVSRRDTTVVLTGETGTGKELVAQAIHQLSPRKERPFVVVNCAAIPEALLEAELFGHVRGAFTGAIQSRLGRIHAAHEGTLFLDEVGELPLSMQAKLLRFLQDGEVQRLGSSDLFRVDVRVIAATNANLLQRVSEGTMRQDLYYRLAVFPIELPPLRQHPEDIMLLADHSLAQLCQQANVPVRVFSPATSRLLQQYAWPGNVRELQHVVERAFILAEDALSLLPEHFSLPQHGH